MTIELEQRYEIERGKSLDRKISYFYTPYDITLDTMDGVDERDEWIERQRRARVLRIGEEMRQMRHERAVRKVEIPLETTQDNLSSNSVCLVLFKV